MSIPFYSNLDMNNNKIENTEALAGSSNIKIYQAKGSSGSSTFEITDDTLVIEDGTTIYAYPDRTNESLYGGFNLKVNGVNYPVYFSTTGNTMEDNYLIHNTIYQFIFDKTNTKVYIVGGYICNRADMYRYGLVKISQSLSSTWSTVPATAAVYNATNTLQTNINNLAATKASANTLGLIKIGEGLSIDSDGVVSASSSSSNQITYIEEADFSTPKGLWEYDEGIYFVKCYYFRCYTKLADKNAGTSTSFTGPCLIVVDYHGTLSYTRRVSVYAGDEVFYCAYNNLGGPSANQFDFKYTNYLAKDNTDTYTPTADFHPTTKKYVDDKDVVTYKTYSGGQIGLTDSVNAHSITSKSELTLLDCEYNYLNIQYTGNMMNYWFRIDLPEGAINSDYIYILSDIPFDEFDTGVHYFIPNVVTVHNRASEEVKVPLSATLCRIDGCLAVKITAINMILETNYLIEGTGMFLYRLK